MSLNRPSRLVLRGAIFFAIASFILFGFSSCATNGNGASKEPESYGALGSATGPIPFTKDVRTGVLPNGTRYFIRENKKPEGRAFLRVVVDAGSVLETDEEQGLAHFVEHMSFNGTEHFPKSELIDYLRSLGMRFGPEINAYTSFDETVYGIEVPTEITADGSKMVADRALAVIDDWTHAVSFKSEDVDAERPVILEEYRTGLGAMDRINRKILPAILGGSPYAERLPIGLTEIIKTAPAERLANFYRKWYRPDNMALVFVGDFDAAKLEAELATHFTAPAPKDKLDRPRYELPEPQKGRINVSIATDPELTYGYVELDYKRPPVAIGDDLRSYRTGLLENLIDQMIAARFQEETTKPETPYAYASSGTERFGKASRFYTMLAVPEPGAIEETLTALLREKESIARYGFSDAEIGRAKKSLISYLEKAETEKDKLESSTLADELRNHFLQGEPVPGIEWEVQAARVMLADMTSEEVTQASKDLFAADDLTVLLIAPDADAGKIPPDARVKALVAESKTAKIERPVSENIGDNLIDTPPSPGRILSERSDKAAETTIWELSNGSRVILKSTTNKNDEIALSALARGGTTSVSDAEAMSAIFAPNMLSSSGIGDFSLPDLTKILAGKQVSLNYWGTDYVRGFQGSAAGKDLKTLFELLYLSFTKPRVDNDAVTALMDRARTVYLQRRENPDAVFYDAVTSTITSGHPRFAPPTVDDLAEVSAQAARNILKNQLTTGDFTFVFVGNIDQNTIRPLVETYIASIPGKRSGATWTDLGMKRPGKVETTVRKGREEKSRVFLGWYVDSDYTERSVAVAKTLEEYLDIRLIEEIREKLGGVYSTFASANVSAAPKGELSLYVTFVCDPKRTDELANATEAEVRSVRDGSINADTFAKAIKALKKNYEESIQSNNYLASALVNLDVVAGMDSAALYARPALYDSVTPEDLSAAARKLMEHGEARVTLYPEITN